MAEHQQHQRNHLQKTIQSHIPTIKSQTETQNNRVFMAVDDVDITFTLKKELEQSGISEDVFNDPITALFNFKGDYYDLILLAAKMPHINCFELY
jgi:PleD family two-component response regulator